MVDRVTLRADAIAGLTGGLVLVPQGVAFATIAGMPPEYGLYAAMLPAIVAAMWGSSWHLVSGPTTAISIVVFATMSPLAEPGSAEYVALVLTLTFLVGLFQLTAGLPCAWERWSISCRMRWWSDFTAGAAVLIAASQVKNFFGIDIARGSSVWRVLLGRGEQRHADQPVGDLCRGVTVHRCQCVDPPLAATCALHDCRPGGGRPDWRSAQLDFWQ
jgi:SulP family sulfate permease